MKFSEIFTKATYQKIKHVYCVYPYHETMQAEQLSRFNGEELMRKYSEVSQLSKSWLFVILTAIKVLILVVAPFFILNYLSSLLPMEFASESGWGFMDLLVAVFILWDSVRIYKNIKNYYPDLINGEISRRVKIRLGISTP